MVSDFWFLRHVPRTAHVFAYTVRVRLRELSVHLLLALWIQCRQLTYSWYSTEQHRIALCHRVQLLLRLFFHFSLQGFHFRPRYHPSRFQTARTSTRRIIQNLQEVSRRYLEASSRPPLFWVQKMYFQNGPPLSLDQQLRRSKKFQIFYLVRPLHRFGCCFPRHHDVCDFLQPDDGGLENPHAKEGLRLCFHRRGVCLYWGDFVHVFHVWVALRITRINWR